MLKKPKLRILMRQIRNCTPRPLCRVCPAESLIPTLPLKPTQVRHPKTADHLTHQPHVTRINNRDQQTIPAWRWPSFFENASRGSKKVGNIVQGKSKKSLQTLYINLTLSIGPDGQKWLQTTKKRKRCNPLAIMGYGTLENLHATCRKVPNTRR